jgi:hypothetical protein
MPPACLTRAEGCAQSRRAGAPHRGDGALEDLNKPTACLDSGTEEWGDNLRDHQHVEALHLALESRLDSRLTPAGWRADPTAIVGIDDGVIGHFRYTLNEDFSATAWFAWRGDWPPLQVDSFFGVSYERSFRVWPYLLSGYPHSELVVDAEDLGYDTGPVKLWDAAEVDRAVELLVAPAFERAIEWAKRFASVEVLLDALKSDIERDRAIIELMDIPVLLAASGRSAEADQALAGALVQHREETQGLLMDDFVLKFRSWLQTGAPPYL